MSTEISPQQFSLILWEPGRTTGTSLPCQCQNVDGSGDFPCKLFNPCRHRNHIAGTPAVKEKGVDTVTGVALWLNCWGVWGRSTRDWWLLKPKKIQKKELFFSPRKDFPGEAVLVQMGGEAVPTSPVPQCLLQVMPTPKAVQSLHGHFWQRDVCARQEFSPWRSHPACLCESRAGGSTNLVFSFSSKHFTCPLQSEARDPGRCCDCVSSAVAWGYYYALVSDAERVN